MATKAPKGQSKKVDAQPIFHQKGKPTQPYGTLVTHPIDLSEKARSASIEALNQLLVDTMVLRDLYKKHHWQVTGPTFGQLHQLYDAHFKSQITLMDMIGERIQTLGGVTLATPHDVVERTRIARPPRDREQVPVQLSRLVDAHTVILEQARRAARLSAQNEDAATNNLITSFVLPENEKQVWFLSNHLADVGLVRAR